jgi:hypothetical protein
LGRNRKGEKTPTRNSPTPPPVEGEEKPDDVIKAVFPHLFLRSN